ncbi:MAG: single-stranded DNA-binding protein [Clostridia bacterium]
MNKVILIGNLTRDPEVRTTGSGTNVCSFTIAVNRKFSNQAGEKVTDYFNIVAWRQLGELRGLW